MAARGHLDRVVRHLRRWAKAEPAGGSPGDGQLLERFAAGGNQAALEELVRGRARLHARLVRRGLTLPAALLALDAAGGGATAGVPAGLASATVRAALALAAGGELARAGVSAEVVRLAEWALKGALTARL